MKYRVAAFLVVGILMVSGMAFAHHGAAAYDTAKNVTIKGTVKEFRFINPHVLIFIDAKDDKGTMQTWNGELTSPNILQRAGWTPKSIQPGQQLTMIGNPSKSGSPSIWIRKVLSPTGEEMNLGQGGG